MNDLIKALQIFLQYGNPDSPCHCEHDTLYIDIDRDLVSEDDKKKLDELGFFISEDSEYEPGFISFRYGSC